MFSTQTTLKCNSINGSSCLKGITLTITFLLTYSVTYISLQFVTKSDNVYFSHVFSCFDD